MPSTMNSKSLLGYERWKSRRIENSGRMEIQKDRKDLVFPICV